MTKENAHLYLPYMQALVNGKTVEFSPSCGAINDWREQSVDFSASHDCYRIKPKPVMILLGPEDVPPGSVLRFKSWGREQPISCWVAILQVTASGGILVATTAPEWVEWDDLNAEYQIKRPGEDWKPCHKEANA